MGRVILGRAGAAGQHPRVADLFEAAVHDRFIAARWRRRVRGRHVDRRRQQRRIAGQETTDKQADQQSGQPTPLPVRRASAVCGVNRLEQGLRLLPVVGRFNCAGWESFLICQADLPRGPDILPQLSRTSAPNGSHLIHTPRFDSTLSTPYSHSTPTHLTRSTLRRSHAGSRSDPAQCATPADRSPPSARAAGAVAVLGRPHLPHS